MRRRPLRHFDWLLHNDNPLRSATVPNVERHYSPIRIIRYFCPTSVQTF